jgi:hypothetical protein
MKSNVTERWYLKTFRHYNVVHNQTYRKQEKQKTGLKKKKDNEKDNDKKKGGIYLRQ